MKRKKMFITGIMALLLLCLGLVCTGWVLFLWERHMLTKGVPELHEAVMKGDMDGVITLLESGANVNELAAVYGRADRSTPLCVAANEGNKAIVEILVANGASVNKGSPLTYAAGENHIEIMQYLLDKGANPKKRAFSGATAYGCAIATGNVEILKLLVAHGVKIRIDDDLAYNAGESGSLELVKYLSSKGVDFSTPKAACGAAGGGSVEVVGYLMSKGVNFDVKAPDGRVPVIHAAWSRKLPVLKLIVEKGVDINRTDFDDATVLHAAARMSDFSAVEYLLANGAKISVVDVRGRTPLHAAAAFGDIQSADVLISHGVDVNAKDYEGQTALDFAKQSNKHELATLLRDRGAKD